MAKSNIVSLHSKRGVQSHQVSKILNRESFAPITEAILPNKLQLGGSELHLDFSACERIETSGLAAMLEFAEALAEQDCFIYIDNINNALFKAIKITGKQKYFRFVHQGEYISRQFGSGGPRC